MSDTVKRSIYYYELFSVDYDPQDNTARRDRANAYINEFWKRYSERQRGVSIYKDFIVRARQGSLFIIVDNVQNNTYFFRLVLCRENALPFIEQDGKLESLGDYIDNNQNIAEVTHGVFYASYGILGLEYNANGARAASLVEFIKESDEESPIVYCVPKLNNDAYSKIIDGQDYTLFDLAVPMDSEVYTKVLSKKPLFRVFQHNFSDTDTFEVVIKKRRSKKNGNKGFELPLTDKEIKEMLSNYREEIKKLTISQGGFSECIDLLSDKFVGKASIVKTEKRSIDSNAMYLEIDDYFNMHVKSSCDKVLS